MRRLLGLARSMLIYWRPGRQRGLRTLYSSFVSAGDLVFDVGAHLGDRTVAFCDLGARVIAIEPQEDVLPWLRRRIGRKTVSYKNHPPPPTHPPPPISIRNRPPPIATPKRRKAASDVY